MRSIVDLVEPNDALLDEKVNDVLDTRQIPFEFVQDELMRDDSAFALG